jgi:hypothetical protein
VKLRYAIVVAAQALPSAFFGIETNIPQMLKLPRTRKSRIVTILSAISRSAQSDFEVSTAAQALPSLTFWEQTHHNHLSGRMLKTPAMTRYPQT